MSFFDTFVAFGLVLLALIIVAAIIYVVVVGMIKLRRYLNAMMVSRMTRER